MHFFFCLITFENWGGGGGASEGIGNDRLYQLQGN